MITNGSALDQQPDWLAEALALQAAGMSPLPLAPDGTKRPKVNSWTRYQDNLMDMAVVVSLFTGTDTDGLGVVCGAASGGLEMLELEGRAVQAGLLNDLAAGCESAGIGQTWAAVSTGWPTYTPSGGLHYHFRVTDGPALENTKLASRPATVDELATDPNPRRVLIETRGQRGFTIVPPSNGRSHPNGGAWLSASGGPHTIPAITCTERDQLYAVARSLDQMPPPARTAPQPSTAATRPAAGELSPADDYAQRTDWTAILIGWTEVRPPPRPGAPEAYRGWRRPGKAEGISATTGLDPERDRLYVFSTSTEFEAERSYTKFGAYALLNHGGEHSAAAAELRRQGFGGAVDNGLGAANFARDRGVAGDERVGGDRDRGVAGDERVGGDLNGAEAAAVADYLAGTTEDYAARSHRISVAELRDALASPASRLIVPRSDWDGAELIAAEFRPTRDLMAGVIPIGTTLLSAAPKVGKSRFLAQLVVSALFGAPLVGRSVERTTVLWLSLEDGARRTRQTILELTAGLQLEHGLLRILTVSQRLDDGGLAEIEAHLDANPDCGLVGLDVLERVRSMDRRSMDRYRADYNALAPLQQMANRRGISAVVVHHTNQRADVVDVFEKVSGTAGLIGVVDAIAILQRRRADDVGTLSLTGREVQDQTLALGFLDGWWSLPPEGMPADLLGERAEIRALWLYLAEHDGASTEELAKEYRRSENATGKLLRRLEDQQLVDSLNKASAGNPVRWQVVRVQI